MKIVIGSPDSGVSLGGCICTLRPMGGKRLFPSVLSRGDIMVSADAILDYFVVVSVISF